jgi:virginiamycin B lyase
VFPLADESSGPNGIIAGADGNLWFTEFNAKKIGRITPTGQITEFPLPGGIPVDTGPHEIAAEPDGNLWFSIPGANKVAQITPSGVVTEFQLPPPPAGTAGALQVPPTRRPASITAGPDGNLWFTERDINAIGRITPDGKFTSFSLPYNRWSPGMNDDIGEIGVADGAIWFSEQVSKCVGRITPDGVVNEFADAPAPGTNPASTLTVGPGGDLWFTEMVYQSPSNIIARLNPRPPAKPRVPCPPPSSES